MRSWRILSVVAAAAVLAGCSTLPPSSNDYALEREAVAGTHNPPPQSLPTRPAGQGNPATPATSSVHQGSGVFVRALGAPAAHGGTSGKAEKGAKGVVFNFEDQPVEAVVKAVLGDFLKRNYAIEPGVKGAITFSTARPVPPDEALPILETLLSWTGNALVEKNGRFLVLPAKDAVAGNLAPSLGATAPGAGLTARLFPLHFISASEMKKLLKPFAPESAFLLVDPMRNVLVMAGTPEQLADYQRTIQTFDVDWLKGMSVGVYTLQHASVTQLMPQLDKLFGPKGSTPLAGMLRFIPIKRTNAIVVITSQPDYLAEVHQWINRIDAGGGNQPQLYVYDVKNMPANTLAGYINQIYNGSGGVGGNQTGAAGSVAPGLTSSTLGSGSASGRGAGEASAIGTGSRGLGSSDTSSGGSSMSGSMGGSSDEGSGIGGTSSVGSDTFSSNNDVGGGTGAGGGLASKNGVRVTAINANNQLLIRCRPSQWAQIESAIQRLDVVPLQVQIETRILEVQLTGKFSFGVQWYLEGLIGGHSDGKGGYVPGQPGNQQQWALGQGGGSFVPGSDAFFYSFLNSNLQAAVHAIETNGNTKVLSEPSVVVMNNHTASIQVGTQVPVNQTYFAAGLSSSLDNGGINTVGEVNYKDTGVILKVRPRVNPGGLVYLNLDQVVSDLGNKDSFGNYSINSRELATQIAVQSGQTVLLGGLIQQSDGNSQSGVPWLSRIPVLGRLFGSTDRSKNRTELLILITPRIITSSADARAATLDYQRQFESLAPLRKQEAKAVKTQP
ncbi:MAG TPA: type II secretion system secretin GspD [Rhodanobacteraceae bacterium]